MKAFGKDIKLLIVMFLLFSSSKICFCQTIDMEYIQAAVEYNDSLLKNFVVDFTNTYVFVDHRLLEAIGESEQRIGSHSCSYVWEGRKWRCEETQTNPKGEVRWEGWTAVNESRTMTFRPKRDDIPANSRLLGVISPKNGPNVSDIVPDRFMLANVCGERLGSILKQGCGKFLGRQTLNEQEVLVLELHSKDQNKVKVFLDPAKDFSIIREEIYAVPDDRLALVFDNITLKKVDEGIWFPVSGDVTLYMQDEEGKQYKAQVIRMEVTEGSLRINQDIPVKTFQIDYPPGTRVWDQTADIQFVVGAQHPDIPTDKNNKKPPLQNTADLEANKTTSERKIVKPYLLLIAGGILISVVLAAGLLFYYKRTRRHTNVGK